MKSIHHFLFLLGALLLASCEKMATNVDIPRAEAKMVLFGFISPEEDYIKIQLALSKPVFGAQSGSNPYTPISDGIVTITNDGGQSAVLVYADSVSGYVVSKAVFPVEPGRKYMVTASAASRKVSASCTVPDDTVGYADITARKTGEPGVSDGPLYRYQYKWNDVPGKRNYYRATSQSAYDYGMGYVYYQDICNTLLTDEGRDGGVLSGTCEDYNSYYEGDTARNTLNFYLLNTDEHYYEYHRRRIDYFGDDPFSEPFPQYSNVDGGLGVFSAYRKTMMKIKVSQ